MIAATDKDELNVDYRNKASTLVRETLFRLYGRDVFHTLAVTGAGHKPGTYTFHESHFLVHISPEPASFSKTLMGILVLLIKNFYIIINFLFSGCKERGRKKVKSNRDKVYRQLNDSKDVVVKLKRKVEKPFTIGCC